MADTTVVNVRDIRDYNAWDIYDIYIGRAVPRRGFAASPFANPFPIGEEHNRASVLAFFERWVRTSDDPRAIWIREHLEELRGKRLGCWCHPKPCHGHILIRLLDETLHAGDSDASHADPLGEVA